jgi:hypothetical protein
MDRAANDENLTIEDRGKAEAEIEREWARAVKRRLTVLGPKPSKVTPKKNTPKPLPPSRVKEIADAGEVIKMQMYSQRAASFR